MSDFKPFGWHSENLCPKCGDTWYHNFEFVDGVNVSTLRGPRETIGPAYLKVTCRRCGYWVGMACKDA